MLCLVFTLAGCTSGEKNNSDAAATQKQVQKDESPSSKKEEKNNSEIKLNQEVTVDDVCTFSVQSAKFTTKVVPPKPNDFYTYYQIKDTNNVYIDIILKYKNLFSSAKSADEVGDINVKYDNKYEYDSFSTIEKDGGGDFTYTNITNINPLKTSSLHYICELPKEAQNDKKPVVATLKIEGKEYKLKIK